MKLYVNRADVVEECQLPLDPARREEFVEIEAKGAGNCRRRRLETLAPDVAAALSDVNAAILALASGQDEVVNFLGKRLGPARRRKDLSGAVDGVGLILRERRRQMTDEGWDEAHDDRHAQGELAWAAVCYAAREPVYTMLRGEHVSFFDPWPWDDAWDKRGQHNWYRRIQIAGALLAAELDRIRRRRERLGLQVCRECGCSEDMACMDVEGPCEWAEEGLCTACARKEA